MIKPEDVAEKINSEIKAWSKDCARLAIAIDGYAGSGKTTVSDILAKQNPDALVVHLDDFIKPVDERKKLMEEAEDKSKLFEFQWYRYEALEKLIAAFKTGIETKYEELIYSFETHKFALQSFDLSKKILIIEGIFLFHPKHAISQMFDKKIYLDADFDKADGRRIAREMKRWGKDYMPENHPDNWTRYFKEAYARYAIECNPSEKADLVCKN